MATLLLKSLITGYILVALFAFIMFPSGGAFVVFAAPIIFWHVTLIVSGLSLLVFKAIEEQKAKKTK